MVESVTAHAEKGAGTKTTLYVGQEEEEEEVEEEEEDAGGWGAGGRKEKPHNPLMISVQKVRLRPGKGKGKSDGWFPQPLTHNTRRVCTDDPENKLPMHSLCPTREWEREWYGVTTRCKGEQTRTRTPQTDMIISMRLVQKVRSTVAMVQLVRVG